MNESGGPKNESAWRAILWGALAAVLGISLLVKAVDAHGRNASLHRRLKASESELDRIRADQARMRAELKALNEDPLYLDSMMQRTAAGRPREPVVEK